MQYHLRIYLYTNDTNGNVTKFIFDSDGDGKANSIYKYTYDSLQNRTIEDLDTDADGKSNILKYYTYDCNNNKTKYELDSDASGKIVHIENFLYGNNVKCTNLSNSVAHKLEINVTQSGYYRLGLCNASFKTMMALSSNSFCDSTIAFSTSGCNNGNSLFYTNLMKGTYYLTIAGTSITEKGKYTLDIVRMGALSTKDIVKSSFILYPNPANNTLNIEYVNNNQTSAYDIYSINGAKVLTGKAHNNSLDISNLDAGVYFLKILSPDNTGSFYHKFVKL